jgi:A/G-specific adenine glycosylase
MTASFAERLVHWQQQCGRHDLPWQRDRRDAYRVWLSEVMLQQTQVTTVLGYYERFLQRWPDVKALAAANLDDVLAAWSGLGYYSRARNLHRCAGVVADELDGRFPCDAEALARLPGIGASTAAAIASICFEQRAAILDGNVKRVLMRHRAIDADPTATATLRQLQGLAEALLPSAGPAMPIYTQAIMDLGATLCTPRQPQCQRCPVAADCAGRACGEPTRFPPRRSRPVKARAQREHWWLWLQQGDSVWLEQRPAQGVWAGLWTLPLHESEAACRAQIPPLVGVEIEPLETIRHVLTHFDWLLHPVLVRWMPSPGRLIAAESGSASGRWFSHDEARELALPAPLRRLLFDPVSR